tara:strand:+ start:286 stop:651 length:366 start_codon:yes stop_codon:yes gene_type:complete
VPPDSPANSTQSPQHIAFSFAQNGRIKVERVPTPNVELTEILPGDGQLYVVDELDVKVWQIEGRKLEMMTLFSFPKADIAKGNKVRSPELPMGVRAKLMSGGINDIEQSTNVWVHAIEPAK